MVPITQTSNQPGASFVEISIPTTNSGSNAIAAGPNHTFWFTEFNISRIGEYTPFNMSYPFHEYQVPEENAVPATITFDNSTGKVWFTDQKNGAGSVWMFDRTRPLSTAFTQYNTSITGSVPVQVMVDGQGNVWFTELVGNKLGKLNYPSYSLTEYSLPTSNAGPAEIAFQTGPQGQLLVWVTETYADKVARLDTSTNTFKECVSPNGIHAPVGIVVDDNGTVWVSEHGGSFIVSLDTTTSSFTKYPTSLPSNYDISAPATLNLDNNGRLWFVEHFLNRVGRLDPASRTIDEFNIPTSASGTLLAYSLQSALDQNGDFYFTEFYPNKIGMLFSNATSPVTLETPRTRILGLVAGQTATLELPISNKLAAPLHVGLGVSSSFTRTGVTSSKQAFVNPAQISLGPHANGTTILSVTPGLLASSGLYSVSLSASDGNASSIGILFIKVSQSLAGIVITYLPVIAIISAIVVGGAYLYARRRPGQRSTPSPRANLQQPPGSPTRLVVLVAASLLLTRLATSLLPVAQIPVYVNAKCPGLPPPSPSFNGGVAGLDYGEILDIAAIAFFVLVLLLALRKWRNDCKADKNKL
ncbi:hypothetical protein E6H36_05375 [Candidatus Bathyarchaeota archaeon]|nr:MAG: hypothetical protein E6H36_05375 [Candidatus Bathyarchaeota archaeon]TMI31594.1 MAG: hypothetical protein E6H29_05155 [Candidatus Bathyarchaeota archaeon]